MSGPMRIFSIPSSATSHAAVAAEETEFKKMRFKPVARDIIPEDVRITDNEKMRVQKLMKKPSLTREEELELVKFKMLISTNVDIQLILEDAFGGGTGQSIVQTLAMERLFNDAAEIVRERNTYIDDLDETNLDEVSMKRFRKRFDAVFNAIFAQPDPSQTPLPQPLAPKNLFGGAGERDEFVTHLMDEMSILVRDGMQPVYTFLGMVAARLGMNSSSTLYRYREKGESLESRQDPVVKTALTVDDFIFQNKHLGRPLIELFLMAVLKKQNLFGTGKKSGETFAQHWNATGIKPTLVGALIDQSDQEFVRAYLDSTLPANAVSYGAQWVYGVLDYEAVKSVVDNTCWGAISAALSQVRRIPNCARFELKQLMLSSGVSDQFAFLCASSFMVGSGGNASAGRINVNNNGKVQGTTYNLSAGFQTRTNLSAQIECCHYWFERVFEQVNPALTELQQELDDYDRTHGAALGATYMGRSDADLLRMSAALGAVGAVGAQDFVAHQLRIVKVEKLRISRQMVQKTLIHYE